MILFQLVVIKLQGDICKTAIRRLFKCFIGIEITSQTNQRETFKYTHQISHFTSY